MIQLVFVLIFFHSPKSLAAACCGGGFGTPTIITGDDKAQLTSSLSQSTVSDDVSSEGLWYHRKNKDQTNTLKIEGATLVSDRVQLGISLPFSQRSIDTSSSGSSLGLGDISMVGAYEILPEFEYSVWRPKGYIYSLVTAPAGKSIYESEDSSGVDVMGRGFWSWGVGLVLSKTVSNFDFQFLANVQKFFDRKVNGFNGGEELFVKPGWGSSLSLGGGYNYKAYRLGSSLIFSHEDPIVSVGSVNSNGVSREFATFSVLLSYLLDPQWAMSMSYSDQRLFGTPVNTTLNQTWMVSLQRRWPR